MPEESNKNDDLSSQNNHTEKKGTTTSSTSSTTSFKKNKMARHAMKSRLSTYKCTGTLEYNEKMLINSQKPRCHGIEQRLKTHNTAFREAISQTNSFHKDQKQLYLRNHKMSGRIAGVTDVVKQGMKEHSHRSNQLGVTQFWYDRANVLSSNKVYPDDEDAFDDDMYYEKAGVLRRSNDKAKVALSSTKKKKQIVFPQGIPAFSYSCYGVTEYVVLESNDARFPRMTSLNKQIRKQQIDQQEKLHKQGQPPRLTKDVRFALLLDVPFTTLGIQSKTVPKSVNQIINAGFLSIRTEQRQEMVEEVFHQNNIVDEKAQILDKQSQQTSNLQIQQQKPKDLSQMTIDDIIEKLPTKEDREKVFDFGNKIVEKMKENASIIQNNVTDDFFPERIQKSSERILNQFGNTVVLMKKSANRLYEYWIDSSSNGDK